MGKLIQLLALSLAWPMSLAAQSAGNFSPALVPQTKPAATKDEKPAAEAAASPIPQIPSRYAGGEINTYIASLSAAFSIRERATDPFAQSQDPSVKPIKPKISSSSNARAAQYPTIKFSEIISKISVTTVMPGEGRFLIKDRSFRKGDRFPIQFGAKTYRTEIVEVSARNILFRNLENGETGSLALDVMPQGMSKGNKGILAPGVRPTSAEIPLEIDSDSNSLSSAPGRNN